VSGHWFVVGSENPTPKQRSTCFQRPKKIAPSLPTATRGFSRAVSCPTDGERRTTARHGTGNNAYVARSAGRSPRSRSCRISRGSIWSRRTAARPDTASPRSRRSWCNGSTGRTGSGPGRNPVFPDTGTRRSAATARALGLRDGHGHC